jgi:hypothetical protein
VVGTFTADEFVDGGTSGALGFIIDVGPTPAVLQHLSGPDFADGETITGRESGATATINEGTYGRCTASNRRLEVSTNTDTAVGQTVAQSQRVTPYIAGHDGVAMFTTEFPDGGAADVTLWGGAFHEQDGYAVGYSGADPAVMFRRGGTTTPVLKTAFNIDKLDGSEGGDNPSGYNADWTKPQIFRVQHGFLGAAGAVFYIKTVELAWAPFHIISGIGDDANFPIILDPHLPVRLEATKGAAVAGTYRIRSASWNSGTIGPPVILGRTFSITVEDSFSGTAPVFSIRNKRTFNGVQNRSTLVLLAISVGSDGKSLFDIIKNAVLTGESWSDHDEDDSFTEIDQSATAYSGGKVLTTYVKNTDGDRFQARNDQLIIQPGEIMTFTAQNTGVRGITWSVRWLEYL